jgi:hypothetical protein
MKRWFRPMSWVCLGGLLALFGLPQCACAQEGQGKYVTEAAVRLIKLVGSANKEGYALQDDKFSIGGGWLNQGKEKWVALYKVELEQGKKYRFIAVGDEDAKDVDLEVKDADGKVVARDVKTDPEAVVDFAPTASGTFAVQIRLYDSVRNLPCVCLAVVMTKKD